MSENRLTVSFSTKGALVSQDRTTVDKAMAHQIYMGPVRQPTHHGLSFSTYESITDSCMTQDTIAVGLWLTRGANCEVIIGLVSTDGACV